MKVGFNAGDGRNYYSHNSSLTDNIRYIYSQSNVATRGRFLYQVDGELDVWNTPTFSSSPTLRGPTLVNGLWIEFYCDVNTTVTDPTARYVIQDLFHMLLPWHLQAAYCFSGVSPCLGVRRGVNWPERTGSSFRLKVLLLKRDFGLLVA